MTLSCVRLEDAVGLVKLHLLCYPESDLATSLKEQTPSKEATDNSLLEVSTTYTIASSPDHKREGREKLLFILLSLVVCMGTRLIKHLLFLMTVVL